MFDYDVSVLEEFSFESIYDLFAIIAQVYTTKEINSNNLSFDYCEKTTYLGDTKNKEIMEMIQKIQSLITDIYINNGEYQEVKLKITNTPNQKGSILNNILRLHYNSLFEKKKSIIENAALNTNNIYQKKFASNSMTTDISSSIDPDFLNECFFYISESPIAYTSFYRRLRTNLDRQNVIALESIVSSTCFPLKLRIAFKKGSARQKKYTPIFNEIDTLQDQLFCFFGIEGINPNKFSTYVLKAANKTNIFRQIKLGSLSYKNFMTILDALDAKIEIVLTDEIIDRYKKYQSIIKNTISLYTNSLKTSHIESYNIRETEINDLQLTLKKDIIKKEPELQLANYFIQLEELRKKREKNMESKKEVD